MMEEQKKPAADPAGPGPKETTGSGSVTGALDEIEAELRAARAKADENWDLFLRARADFENYRKNIEREREATIRRGKKDVFLKLLEIRDNMERAISVKPVSLDALKAGVEITARQMDALLLAEGIKPVESVGRPFDPSMHEAIVSWESADVAEDTCTDEIQKGYTYKSEIFRAARVRVARPAPRGGERPLQTAEKPGTEDDKSR